jgi:hypothetical protein
LQRARRALHRERAAPAEKLRELRMKSLHANPVLAPVHLAKLQKNVPACFFC